MRVSEREPGKCWRSATHTASTSVPGSRAEKKSGLTSSIWLAAVPDSQPVTPGWVTFQLQISCSCSGQDAINFGPEAAALLEMD